jgi:hypothetical protein
MNFPGWGWLRPAIDPWMGHPLTFEIHPPVLAPFNWFEVGTP